MHITCLSGKKLSPCIFLYVLKAEKQSLPFFASAHAAPHNKTPVYKATAANLTAYTTAAALFAGHLTVLSAPEKTQKPRTACRNTVYAGAR